MAYFCTPSSYASTFYDSPFSRRRPSPPPTTYYSRSNAYDPYVRAIAEEQVARSALQDAIQREQEARRRRTQEEARARARAQETARARSRAARQHAGMFYGLPARYQYADYPECGYGYGYEYGDEGDEDDEIKDTYSPFIHFYSTPEFVSKQGSAPPMSRSSSLRPSQQELRAKETEGQSSSKESTPKVSIPINTPSSQTSQHSDQVRNEAVLKIQTIYRKHVARKAALTEIESIRQRFETQCNAFSFPSVLDFQDDPASPEASAAPEERPRLAYTAHNTPVHVHEDALVKMLQALDSVESHGDATVRDVRRTLVRAVEEELGRVDAAVRRVWEELVVQAKAESHKTTEEPMEVLLDLASESDTTVEAVVDQPALAADQALPTMDVESASIAESIVQPVAEKTESGMEEPEARTFPPAEKTNIESTTSTAAESPFDEIAIDDVPIPSTIDNALGQMAHPISTLAPPPPAADVVFEPIPISEPPLNADSETDSEVETPSQPAVAFPAAQVVSAEDRQDDREEEDDTVLVEETLKTPDGYEKNSETAVVDTEFVLV
ncbi:hypothetical protein EW145_g3983 [Phellinidium pouzarii]|uniref:BAG domain-containing protein n=1 Tax=Phellinidium pouzarii TaxID=167371 RepID=A0A4S4L702_9AGAM|nr:hypothetical protein EW145_g3983 [Phellinidium pouzarii]